MKFICTEDGGAVNADAVHRIAPAPKSYFRSVIYGADDRVLGIANEDPVTLAGHLNASNNAPAAPGTFLLAGVSYEGDPTVERHAVIAWRFDAFGPSPVTALTGTTDDKPGDVTPLAVEFPDGHVESLEYGSRGTWASLAAWSSEPENSPHSVGWWNAQGRRKQATDVSS